jgi:hypothetical protein
MSDSVILGGAGNSIVDGVRCTIINGANNTIDASNVSTSTINNVHILGNNISANSNDIFYIGCNVEALGDIHSEGTIHSDDNITAVGDIIVAGDVIAYGDVVASYTTSDERLKDDIQPISGCLNKVLSLDAIEFDWNDKQKTYSGHDIGLIAQQVQEIAPEIVCEKKDGYLGIRYEKIIPLLIGATQEQDLQIENLEKQIQELTEPKS